MRRRRSSGEIVPKKVQALILAAFTLTAGSLQGAVLYAIDDRATRLSLGLALLVIVFWAGARLSIVERSIDLVTPPLHPRRFRKLRSNVEKLLEEVRRLNWIAVDGTQGVRSPEETERLMDDIEGWLKDHIGRIRDSAGEGD